MKSAHRFPAVIYPFALEPNLIGAAGRILDGEAGIRIVLARPVGMELI